MKSSTNLLARISNADPLAPAPGGEVQLASEAGHFVVGCVLKVPVVGKTVRRSDGKVIRTGQVDKANQTIISAFDPDHKLIGAYQFKGIFKMGSIAADKQLIARLVDGRATPIIAPQRPTKRMAIDPETGLPSGSPGTTKLRWKYPTSPALHHLDAFSGKVTAKHQLHFNFRGMRGARSPLTRDLTRWSPDGSAVAMTRGNLVLVFRPKNRQPLLFGISRVDDKVLNPITKQAVVLPPLNEDDRKILWSRERNPATEYVEESGNAAQAIQIVQMRREWLEALQLAVSHGEIMDLRWNADGTTLRSVSANGLRVTWDASTGKPLAADRVDAIGYLCWNATGDKLLAYDMIRLKIIEEGSGVVLYTVTDLERTDRWQPRPRKWWIPSTRVRIWSLGVPAAICSPRFRIWRLPPAEQRVVVQAQDKPADPKHP